jgi:protease I
MAELDDRTVLFVIPPARFKDIELKTPRAFLERKKCNIKVASSQGKASFGMDGFQARPDLTLAEIDLNNYDGLIFVGGMGTRDYWDDAVVHDIAKRAVAAGKVVGATSTAPVILARAGLLDGKDATCYFSETKQITAHGARYTAAAVAVDGNIITCKGPEAVDQFSMAFIKYLTAGPKTSN